MNLEAQRSMPLKTLSQATKVPGGAAPATKKEAANKLKSAVAVPITVAPKIRGTKATQTGALAAKKEIEVRCQ